MAVSSMIRRGAPGMLKETENVNFLRTPGWPSLLCLRFCKNEAEMTLNSLNQITVVKTPNSDVFGIKKRGEGKGKEKGCF